MPTAGDVRGRITFEPASAGSASASGTRVVHAGTFAVDFRPFGFALDTAEALGWDAGRDSLGAVLSPASDHNVVTLSGRLYAGATPDADSVVGRWKFVGDHRSAGGLVYLRRLSAAGAAGGTPGR